MKVDYIRGEGSLTDGLTVITANRREAAFIKAAMTVLFSRVEKARGQLPSPMLEYQGDSIVCDIATADYDPQWISDQINRLETDGKVWYSFIDPQYNLDPRPRPVTNE